VAAGHAVPTVEVRGEGKGGKETRKRAADGDMKEQEEEERDAILRIAVTDLNDQLFTEFMEGFHG
jgi:hypothetical protein